MERDQRDRFLMGLHGIEPPPMPARLGEVADDGQPSAAWRRALELSAKRRRN
jgi:hypothetical protein